MPKKNFILLSMEDDKIKKISNVISNDSCRKILDYLSTKEATESELASKLTIPISTVHYNLQQLLESGLISADEFHYSEKGKEVNHFKLANKYIIIAPKNTFGIKQKLKSILPVVIIASGTALAIHFANKYFSRGAVTAESDLGARAMAAPVMEAAIETIQQASAHPVVTNIALWFLVGAVFALLVYFIIGLIRKDVD